MDEQYRQRLEEIAREMITYKVQTYTSGVTCDATLK